MNDRFRFRAIIKQGGKIYFAYSDYDKEIPEAFDFKLELEDGEWNVLQYNWVEYEDSDELEWIDKYRGDYEILGIEQCTGLKDKNGKPIYENDIIDTPNGIYRVAVDDFGLWTAIYKGNPLKDVVEWSDIVKNYAFNKENVEIVILGNIHQDKELLDE